MNETCLNCWARYPAGTTYCTSCKRPIERTVPVVQQREITAYKIHQPAIVWTIRWFLLLRVMLTIGPFIVAAQRPDTTAWLFGADMGARIGDALTSPGAPGTVTGILAFAGLVSWGLLALPARWFLGRMALFGVVFLAAVVQFVVAKADLSVPANDLGALGSFLCCCVIGYSFVNPKSTQTV